MIFIEMKRYILPIIILLTAIAVSVSAAYYSVFGLSKLFAGASIAVIIMASSLEFAKVIIASTLHTYWNTLYRWLKYYLVVALVVLVAITSAGIYGFLSSAYQVTADTSSISDKRVEILESKKIRFVQNRDQYTSEKTYLIKSSSDLRLNLTSSTQRQTLDKKTGQLITNTFSGNKKGIQSEIDKVSDKISILDSKIESLSDSITNLEIAIIEVKASSESAAELGPLRYLSNLTGISMDRIINWVLLLIIFVFDPLAIALVITANFAFSIKENTQTIPAAISPPIPEVEQKDDDITTQLKNIDKNWSNWSPKKKEQLDTPPAEIETPQKLNNIQQKIKEVLPWAFAKEQKLSPTQIKNTPHQDIKR